MQRCKLIQRRVLQLHGLQGPEVWWHTPEACRYADFPSVVGLIDGEVIRITIWYILGGFYIHYQLLLIHVFWHDDILPNDNQVMVDDTERILPWFSKYSSPIPHRQPHS